MDLALANRLVGPQGRPALLAAAAEADPDSLGAATRLRAHFDNELSAAALSQVTLRRRAVTKFGPPAAMLFFTTEALQQASRPRVSQWRADRMAAVAGAGGAVLDLCCGIGADAMALARAGLAVVAVERDPATAVFAAANLATADGTVVVRVGDAQTLGPALLDADRSAGVFCDPARRDDRGRVWRVDQFSPGWDFVTSLLDGSRPAVVKLGPALPHALIPDGVEAEWVSHQGDIVEVALWAGGDARPGARVATLLDATGSPVGQAEQCVRVGPAPRLPVTEVRSYLHEPDGAAIRAGVLSTIGAACGASLIDAKIAYLTSDRATGSPWLSDFAIIEVLPLADKVIRQWLSARRIGTVEIKKRGVDLDPPALRRRLKLSGPESVSLIVSRTPSGTVAVMAHRVPRPIDPAADDGGTHRPD